MTSEIWMREALKQAEKAASVGEVPVGAIVVHRGQIIAKAHNEVEIRQDPSAHAEILALREAATALGSWRLPEVEVYVTLEPCTMCMGALLLARISKLYFATLDRHLGAAGSVFDLSNHSELPHQFETVHGILASESAKLLSDFFSSLRNRVGK